MSVICCTCKHCSPLNGTYLEDKCRHPSLFQDSKPDFYWGLTTKVYIEGIEIKMSVRNANLRCRDYEAYERSILTIDTTETNVKPGFCSLLLSWLRGSRSKPQKIIRKALK